MPATYLGKGQKMTQARYWRLVAKGANIPSLAGSVVGKGVRGQITAEEKRLGLPQIQNETPLHQTGNAQQFASQIVNYWRKIAGK